MIRTLLVTALLALFAAPATAQEPAATSPEAEAMALDEALEEEMGFLWWDGAPKGHAADLLSGMQHLVPRGRKKSVGAWRLYGAWNRLEYPDRAPPMDRDLTSDPGRLKNP